jgi:hypothetical protein
VADDVDGRKGARGSGHGVDPGRGSWKDGGPDGGGAPWSP